MPASPDTSATAAWSPVITSAASTMPARRANARARPTITGLRPMRPLNTGATLGAPTPAAEPGSAGTASTSVSAARSGRTAVVAADRVARRAGAGRAEVDERCRCGRSPASSPVAATGARCGGADAAGRARFMSSMRSWARRRFISGCMSSCWAPKAARHHRPMCVFEARALRAAEIGRRRSVGLRRSPCAFPALRCSDVCPAPTPHRSSSSRHRPDMGSRGWCGAPPTPTSCGCAASSARWPTGPQRRRRRSSSTTATCSAPTDVERLVEWIEDAPSGLAADRRRPHPVRLLHEAAHLVDGLIIDAGAMAIDAGGGARPSSRSRFDDAGPADRRRRRRQRPGDRHRRSISPCATRRPIRSPSRRGWSASPASTALQHLDAARARRDRPAGASAGDRPPRCSTSSAATGSWTGRSLAGDPAAAAGDRCARPRRRRRRSAPRPLDPEHGRRAGRRAARARTGRLEAVGLLLDAGEHERATQMVMGLSESITDTVEPRQMLSLLARLGPTTDREPGLLLLRAVGDRGARPGRRGRPSTSTGPSSWPPTPIPSLRRRVAIESARARPVRRPPRRGGAHRPGRRWPSWATARRRTYARAHELLAECAATFDAREDLQNAAESYRVAAAAWESCGEFARARACRRDLALGVLAPLGRFDEALAQVSQLLSTPDLSDAERSWTVLVEGFVLFNANRLDSAEARFARVTDLGYVHDNPRLIAAAAWGRALDGVPPRRPVRHAALDRHRREHGARRDRRRARRPVPLRRGHDARRARRARPGRRTYLDRATEPATRCSPARCCRRRSCSTPARAILGDVDECLAHTMPARLVAGQARRRLRRGPQRRRRARPGRCADDASRELVTLGFSDFAALGEGRTYLELQAALQRVGRAGGRRGVDVVVDAGVDAAAPAQHRAPADRDGRRRSPSATARRSPSCRRATRNASSA